MIKSEKQLRVCMISDFFYPNMGGVENHVFNLSQYLLKRGHKVIIITHAYKGGKRVGIRWMGSGLKVYYLPVPIMALQCTWPTIFANVALFYSIFVRERIQHVHGHQAFSNLTHEGIMHARTMGIPCTFTDHSLFGFADIEGILMNKALKYTLSDVQNVICVSNTSKENTVLRAALDPSRVHVIPNAVSTCHLTPDPTKRSKTNVTIVVLSRLVYRKGIDLLVAVIPKICTMLPGVRFLIAGDGPKKVDLEQMRDEHLLHDRVEMFGPVPSEDVRDVLVRGHLFLNTSLTEAFCIAIVEAASCGLLVVSTEVGGVPEVLPSHMLLMAKPEETSLITRIVEAVRLITGREDGFISTNSSPAIRENSISNLSRINPEIFNDNNCRKALESSKRCDQSSIYSISDEIGNSVDQTEIFQSKSLDILFNSNMFTENSCLKKSSMKGGKDGNSQEFSNSNNSNGNRGCSHIIETLSFHEEVSKMYCWEDVAMRTEAVYFQCTHQEGPIRYFDSCESLLRRLAQYYGCGEVFGKIACFIVLIDYALLTILCLLRPQSEIDICPDFDPIKYQQILDEKDG